jgi:hypothetical protein
VHGLHLDTGESRVTVSVGVATLPQDAPTKEGLVECADWAMYLAKSQGRDRVVTYRAGSGVAAAMQEGRPDPKALGAGAGEPGPPATPGADATTAGLAAPRSPGLSTRSVAVDRLAAELAADLGLETQAVLATVRRVLGDE